jgi:NAD(P)-dependent dehydrogenase (short-subunit alcohol dehydrogenase family)
MSALDATGKRIVITGAASGIAQATAAELTSRGARVVGLDRNAGDGAGNAGEKGDKAAADGELIVCDVRDQESVDRALAEAIERLGGLDVLINCAGLATPQSAGLPPDERAIAVIEVNMLGPWRVTSAALGALRQSRGRVVNVASGMSFVALPFAAAYAMSKHGVRAYSQALRLEHGDAIDVTTVYPGNIQTPIHRDSIEFGIKNSSPLESLEAAVDALTRAALDERARLDITTTRTGLIANSLSRYAPARFVDWVILRQIAKAMRRRTFEDPSHPVAEFAQRIKQGTRAPRSDRDARAAAPRT